MQAVILTGRILPDREPVAAWFAAAKLFKLEPDAFTARVLARCPLTIRETGDSAELERIRAGLQGCGAEVQVVESDGSKWNLLHDGRMCGPVPLAYLKLEHEAGRLADDVQVKGPTDAAWTSLPYALAKSEPELTLDVPPPLETESELPPPLPPRKARAASLSDDMLAHTAALSRSGPNFPKKNVLRNGLIAVALLLSVIIILLRAIDHPSVGLSDRGSGSDQTDAPMPVNIDVAIKSDCLPETNGSCFRISLNEIKITSLVSQVIVKDVVVNRGNCKVSKSDESLPFVLAYGEDHEIFMPGCNVIEVSVVTDKGDWTANFK